MPLSGGGAPWLPAGTFSGEGTAFSEAVPGTGAGFACSFRYLNPFFSTNFAAINRPMVRGWVLWAGGRGFVGGYVTVGPGSDSSTARLRRHRFNPSTQLLTPSCPSPSPAAVGRRARVRQVRDGVVRRRPVPR